MSVLSHKAIVITALGNKQVNSLHSPLAMAEADDFLTDGGGPRKRRRLTHLTPDEKVLRRKLKNRVAAQTARDRKKALMTELEEKVAKLQEQNKQLLKENAELRISRSTLQQENQRLKKCLSNTTTTSSSPAAPVKLEGTDSSVFPCKPEPESPRSAAPAVSLPKEQIQALSRLMMQYAACALTSDALLSLLQELNGESGGLKQEAQTDAASPATLCDLGVFADSGEASTGMVGPTAAELESLNELIKFDHIYYKEEPHKATRDIHSSSSDLIHSRQQQHLPPLAPKGIESVRLSIVPTTTTSCVLVDSSMAQPIAVPQVVTTSSTGSSLLAPATLASVTKMVDPNAVCGHVPTTVKNEVNPLSTMAPSTRQSGGCYGAKRANKSSTPAPQMSNTNMQFDASEELLDIESLLGLTDLELASGLQLQDQTVNHPQTISTSQPQQQTVKNANKGPVLQNKARSDSRKRKCSSTSQDSSFEEACSSPIYTNSPMYGLEASSSPVYGLETSELSYCEDAYQESMSDSGISGELSDAPSPGSDMSSALEDDDWQSSFTELFPSLM